MANEKGTPKGASFGVILLYLMLSRPKLGFYKLYIYICMCVLNIYIFTNQSHKERERYIYILIIILIIYSSS